jgi:hypothetical protein
VSCTFEYLQDLSSEDIVKKCLASQAQKRAGGVAHGIGPEFKPQYCQKKKRDWFKM